MLKQFLLVDSLVVRYVHGVNVSAQFNFFETREIISRSIWPQIIFWRKYSNLELGHKSFYVEVVCVCEIEMIERKQSERQGNIEVGFTAFGCLLTSKMESVWRRGGSAMRV